MRLRVDDTAATTVEHLICAAGFDPLKAGGVTDAGRIEGPSGDLNQFGLDGEIIDLEQARSVLAGARTSKAQR
jgi:predicted dinucleotide-binding enzyme